MPTHKDLPPPDLPPDDEWRSTYGVPLAEAFNRVLIFVLLLAVVLGGAAVLYVAISSYIYVMS